MQDSPNKHFIKTKDTLKNKLLTGTNNCERTFYLYTIRLPNKILITLRWSLFTYLDKMTSTKMLFLTQI